MPLSKGKDEEEIHYFSTPNTHTQTHAQIYRAEPCLIISPFPSPGGSERLQPFYRGCWCLPFHLSHVKSMCFQTHTQKATHTGRYILCSKHSTIEIAEKDEEADILRISSSLRFLNSITVKAQHDLIMLHECIIQSF